MPSRRRSQSKRSNLQLDEHIVFVRAANGHLEVKDEQEEDDEPQQAPDPEPVVLDEREAAIVTANRVRIAALRKRPYPFPELWGSMGAANKAAFVGFMAIAFAGIPVFRAHAIPVYWKVPLGVLAGLLLAGAAKSS